MTLRTRRAPSWLQFTAWTATGASAMLVVLGALSVGPFAIVPTAVLAVLAVRLGGTNVSAVGAATGVGAWFFALGWLNRDGPGDVCTSSSDGMKCSEQWAPWPFWLIGSLLVVIPVIVFLHRRHALHRVPAG